MKKLILASTLISILSGCTSSGGISTKYVRVITAEMAQKCDFITTTTGSKYYSFTPERNMNSAVNHAAKSAMLAGANSGVVTNIEMHLNGNGATATMNAYNCK